MKTITKILTHTLTNPKTGKLYGNYESKENAEREALCALIDQGLVLSLTEINPPIEHICTIGGHND